MEEASSYSPVALVRRVYNFYASIARATLDAGWNAAATGFSLSERIAMTLLGATTGGVQGALLLSKALLQEVTPAPIKRMLPDLPLLRGMGDTATPAGGQQGRRQEQQRRQANGEEQVQVIGMGGGYTLNLGSVEAVAEPPSPQYTPRGKLGAQTAANGPGGAQEQFSGKTEAGIGAAAPRAPGMIPGTPGGSRASRFTPLSPEKPGLTDAPHAYGHEVEPLGTEMRGTEEPRIDERGYAAAMAPYVETERHMRGAGAGGADGAEAGGSLTERIHHKFEGTMQRVQDLRGKVATMLHREEEVPVTAEGGGAGGRGAAGAGVGVPGVIPAPFLEGRTHSPVVMMETMPSDITGAEGRQLAPGLEALPEGQEWSHHEAAEGGYAGQQQQQEAAAGPGAEARLKGLFAPAAAAAGIGAAAAAGAAAGRPSTGLPTERRVTAGEMAAGQARPGVEGATSAAQWGGPGYEALTGTAGVSGERGLETGAAGAAEYTAVAAAGGPGSSEMLAGRQGTRIGVQRVELPALGKTIDLESTTISQEQAASEVAAQQKQRIMEGAGLGAAAGAGFGAAAGTAAGGGGVGVGGRVATPAELATAELAPAGPMEVEGAQARRMAVEGEAVPSTAAAATPFSTAGPFDQAAPPMATGMAAEGEGREVTRRELAAGEAEAVGGRAGDAAAPVGEKLGATAVAAPGAEVTGGGEPSTPRTKAAGVDEGRISVLSEAPPTPARTAEATQAAEVPPATKPHTEIAPELPKAAATTTAGAATTTTTPAAAATSPDAGPANLSVAPVKVRRRWWMIGLLPKAATAGVTSTITTTPAITVPPAGQANLSVAPVKKKKGRGPWNKFKKEVKKVFSPPSSV